MKTIEDVVLDNLKSARDRGITDIRQIAGRVAVAIETYLELREDKPVTRHSEPLIAAATEEAVIAVAASRIDVASEKSQSAPPTEENSLVKRFDGIIKDIPIWDSMEDLRQYMMRAFPAYLTVKANGMKEELTLQRSLRGHSLDEKGKNYFVKLTYAPIGMAEGVSHVMQQSDVALSESQVADVVAGLAEAAKVLYGVKTIRVQTPTIEAFSERNAIYGGEAD